MSSRRNPFRREDPRQVARRYARWAQLKPERVKDHMTIVNARRRLGEAAKDSLTVDEWNKRVSEFGFKCAYCGKSQTNLELEHVVPLSRGGDNSKGNVVPACRGCNATKGDMTFDEWRRAGAEISEDALNLLKTLGALKEEDHGTSEQSTEDYLNDIEAGERPGDGRDRV